MIVIGSPGSGKSRFSRALHQATGLPLVHLDLLYWNADQTVVSRSVFLERLQEAVAQDAWIIDGNYDDLLQELRLAMADHIIFVMLPRIQCLFRALRRTKERKAAGYQNDINPWFIRFLLFDCRNSQRKKAYDIILNSYSNKCVVLKSQRDIDRFICDFSMLR